MTELKTVSCPPSADQAEQKQKQSSRHATRAGHKQKQMVPPAFDERARMDMLGCAALLVRLDFETG